MSFQEIMEFPVIGIVYEFSFFYMGGVNTSFWNEIDMKVIPEKMIPVSHIASVIVSSLLAPKNLVTSEITVQPESYQL